MANNTTNFTLRLRTQGLDEAQKQTQIIRDNLEAAARAAAQVGGGTPGTPMPGGSTSSRRVAASRAASPTGAAGATAGIDGGDVEVYNRARGASAAAGGTARDFADISRGLGGFVRLYATLAANLYAAGAAFNFLRTSMDTVNMIKGMDQLGASSGRALGSLSKQLVDATGGAISLREAMEATTKAASANLSNKQILEIGQVARNAAQALGLNMTDAVSRLTRGISKLEPELLDELGIFVKIDDATEKYAKTINKTAAELTDFERRQAFATAAITQGQKKFNEIKLDANPYNQLAATLANLAQSAGEFLNKFLAPIVKYMSQSPAALGVALAFIGVKLLKTVMPALGEYRENLKRTVEESKNRVGQIVRDQERLAGERDQAASTRALASFRAANLAKIEDLKQQAALFSKTNKTDYAALAAVDPIGMTTADFTAWEKKLQRRAKVLDRSNAMEADLLRIHIDEVKQLRLEADNSAARAQQEVEARDSRWYSQMSLTRKNAQRAMKEANRIDILEQVSQAQRLEGPMAAWRKLNQELAAPTRKIKLIDPQTGEEIEQEVARTQGFLGLLERGATRLRGVFGIAAQQVVSFAQAWGPAISAGVGAALAIFQVLDSWLSTNKKQMQEFNSAVEATTSGVKTLVETLEKLSTKDPLEAYNADSVTAVATAIKTVSDNIDTLIIKNEKARDASSWWDNWLDGIKAMWGGDRSTKFAEALVDSTLKSLNSLGSSPEAAKARKQITSILEIDVEATSDQWGDAFKRIEKDSVKLSRVNAIIKGISNTLGEGAEKARNFVEALNRAGDAQKNFLDKYKVKDEFSLLGEEFISIGIQLGDALKRGPLEAINALGEIVKDDKKISLFSDSDQALLVQYKKDITDLQKQRNEQQQNLDKLIAEQNRLATEVPERNAFFKFVEGMEKAQEARGVKTSKIGVTQMILAFDNAQIEEQKKSIDARAEAKAEQIRLLQKTVGETNLKITERVSSLGTIAENQLKRGGEFVEAGISKAFAGVGNVLKNAVLGVTGDLPGAADMRLQMAQEELRSERTLIQTQLDLITSNKELKAEIALATATTREAETSRALKQYSEDTGFTREMIEKSRDPNFAPTGKKLLTEANVATQRRQEAEDLVDVTKKIAKDARTGVKDLQELQSQGSAITAEQFKDLADYALRIAGLQAGLAKLADREQAEKFTNEIGRIQERARADKKKYDDEKRTLELSKQDISLKVKTGALTELQALNEEERISAKLKQNDLAQKNLEIETRIDELKKAQSVNLLKDADKEKTRKETLAKEIQRLTEGQGKVKTEGIQEDEQRRVEFIEKRLQLTIKEIDKQNSLQQSALQTQRIREDTATNLRDIELQTARETGKYTDEYLAQLSYNAEIFKINEEAKRREVDLTSKYQYEKAKLTAQILAEAEKSGFSETGTPEAARLAAEMEALNTRYSEEVQGIRAVSAARAASTQEIYKAKTAQDEFNKSIEQLKGLDSAFKGIGTILADVAVSLDQAAKNQKKYTLEIERLQAVRDSGLADEDRLDVERKLSQVKRRAAQQELTDNARIAGDAKKFFKEKTAAYRVLAALEKAMHIERLIRDAEEIASTVVKTGVAIVQSGKRAFAAGQEAIAAAFAAKPWPLGLVAGGAMIAIMAGLLGKAFGGGGGGAAAPSGFGMEQQRETEGTGKSWVNGQLVDTGGGKPGGGDGRASSLEKGLDLVAKYTFEGLNYSNGMLKALLQIEENTRSAAYAVFRSMNPNDKSTFVGGIPTGQLRPNYLRTGAANTLGAAAGVAGGAVLGSAIAFAGSSFAAGGLLGSVAGKVAGFLGGALSTGMAIALPVIGLLLAKPLGKLFGKIFGGKVTQSIEDSGIVIEGTLNAIVEGTQGVVEEYANLKTVKDRGIFRKKGVSFSTVEQEAQADVKRYFAGIFSGMRDTLKEAGKLLGKDVSAFLDTYVVKDFKVSSKGRTAEEFADALRGEVSEAFNKMAQAAFPELEKFSDAGEEFGETVIRMAKQISVFDTAMKMIGRGGLSSANLRNILSNASVTATTTRQVSTGTTTGTRQVEFDQEVTQQEYDEISAGFVLVNRFVRSISTVPVAIEQFTTVTETSVRRLTATEINDVVLNITDTLIDLAGGMEQFLERAQAIRENFLTDAQKVGQIAAEIRPILDDLGVGSIRSKADFLTILNDAQDNLVTAATNLKAAELTADTADDAPAQQAFDLAAALVTSLMELAPGIAQVLDYEKKLATAREDQAMTIANLLGDEKLITAARDAQRARQLEDMDVALRPGQRYIWALEDEKRIKDELIKLQEDQIKKLEQTKSTVSNLIKTLSDFKSQLLGGSQTILTPQQVYQQKKAEYDALVTAASSSDENIRNSALAKLPQAASSFLDASRTMFASGTAYAADFNSVIQTLDAQGAELLSQEEYLAKQLTELQTATDQLKGINTNTQDTATRMAMLEEALVTSQAAVATAAAMWTSSSGEPIANFLTSTSNGANVVAAINNASANTATQNSQLAQATVGSIVQLGVDVDKSLEKWLKQYGWSNAATATYDNSTGGY